MALGIEQDLTVAEQLLEAISLLDRLSRTELHPLVAGIERPTPPPKESGKILGPRGSRALELALENTYQAALPELSLLMESKGFGVPPHLIVKLLEAAYSLNRTGATIAGQQFLALTGQRGKWLAKQHSEWSDLLPPDDFASNYRKLVMPSEKKALLERWRKDDPEAARLGLAETWEKQTPKQQESLLPALRINLSAADIPFLRNALVPRRKAVRNLASRLLLLAGEETITELFTEIASSWLSGVEQMQLSPDPTHFPILEDYGCYDKKQGPAYSLVANLPPDCWANLMQTSQTDAFGRLLMIKKALLPALLDAVVFYQDAASQQALCRHLLQMDLPQSDLTKKTQDLYELLTPEAYADLCDWGLKNIDQVFRSGSVLRHISLQVAYPWPDAFCKLLIREFLDQMNSRRTFYGFVSNPSWKLLPYRISIDRFPWLRQQLFAATDRGDQLGALATKMLQIVSFRKAATEAIESGK